MLESLTIFNRGGLILYQFTAQPSMIGATDGPAETRKALQTHFFPVAIAGTNPTAAQKQFHIADGLTFVWMQSASDSDRYVVVTYPDIFLEGPRQYLQQWSRSLLQKADEEYTLFFESASAAATATEKLQKIRPDPARYDKTFRVLLEQSKTQKPTTTNAASAAINSAEKDKNEKQSQEGKGKEKRQWHDGKAKVTEKAMAELDKSKQEQNIDGSAVTDDMERALKEARAAYLPTAEDLQQEEAAAEKRGGSNEENEGGWGASITGLLQQLTGNKILTAADLEKPLKQMEEMLTTKNVARSIATDLCAGVQKQLIGKRLNSLYRVQTAVRQSLETTLARVLKNDVDLLRNIDKRRGDSKSMFAGITGGNNRRPYVIAVVGINGVGKSTSLAKLAYYFSTAGGCKPLLVAGDTFRSGAVEQLKVHAACLDVPLYSQGYSKDPSAVAKAAIQQAIEQGNDVVLIDTAGRMQNNVPLMKALGKLVQENQPDFVILVCEALVGHDGLSQFQMFRQALGRRGIDGLILTKFDTVSDKVGAAITLTHETGAPIVFCGTGQKYHHLKKLSVPTVVNSLFAA